MSRSDWSLLGRLLGAATALGVATVGAVTTLLLWLEGLEGGEA